MLLYTILLICISIFFYRESLLLKEMDSKFLSDFNQDTTTAHYAAKQLFLISTCSLISGVLMGFCWLYQTLSQQNSSKVLLACSILIYTGGFILGMYRCYRLKESLSAKK